MFITPWGHCQYCCNPQGLISVDDEFKRRTHAAFSELSNIVKVVDDCLVYSTDFEHHLTDICNILQCARDNSVTLSTKKFVVAVQDIELCSYSLSPNGFTIDAGKTASIRNFPTPTNKKYTTVARG